MHVKADSEAYYMDIASFDGMRIGFLHDSLQLDLMRSFAKQTGFTFAPVFFEESEPMLQALGDGSIDAYVDGVLYGPGTKVVASLSIDPFFFVTRKNDADIMPQINEAMKQLLLNLPTYQARLFDSYLNTSQETPIVFRREEEQWLRTKPVLKVAYSAGQEMMNPDRGSNFLYELFKMFERKSGIRFDYMEYPDYDACIDAVSAGKADVMTNISITASLERPRDILVSKVYYTAPILVIQHLEESVANSSPGRRIVGFTEEMTSVRLSYEKAYPLDSLRVFPTVRECREAFQKREIDAYVWPYPGSTLGEDPPPGSTLLTTRAHYPMSLGYSTRVSPYAISVLDRVISSTPVSTFDTLRLAAARPAIWEEVITKILQHKAAFFGLLFVSATAIAAWRWHKHRNYLAAIDKAAFTDSLTQGRNRARFFLDARTILKNNRGRFCVLYINIRELKIFNMIYGVETGNGLVRFCFHEFDRRSGANELAAYSGSGHYLILWQCDDDDTLEQRIEDLFRVTLAARKEYEKPLVLSCGVYILDDEERRKAELQAASGNMDSSELLAENAVLYAEAAEAHIKNGDYHSQYACYNADTNSRQVRNSLLESRMHKALESGEFQVYMQPKVVLKTGELAGAEALIRWKTKEGNFIYPDEFIPLFEQNGFIRELDLLVLDRVCAWIRRRLENGQKVVPVSVNQSKVLFFRNNYVETVRNTLARHDVPAGLLRVEVTESMAWLDETAFINTLNELSLAGIRLSLDDFGKGYSSLSMLSSFKFNTIKLDKAFLNTSEEKQTSAWIIIESLSELSRKMGIHLLCEGVETELQRKRLVEVGCRYGQGYLFARPMPMEDFESFMDKHPLEKTDC